ncbi:MAG: threonylcarbamoyl-AMP synthase [Bacteroidetes bacterium]|nr:threonylcarbamoyl-AMP synthase [Bacteroidota bacterium]
MAIVTDDIEIAVKKLQNGEVVAFPTETVYGLGANAFSGRKVRKIFELKGRPLFNPLIVHIASADYLDEIATSVPAVAKKLADLYWPGPLTLLLPKSRNIPDLVTAGMPTVAVRVPAHPVAKSLLEKLDFPLAAPSANKFTGISPTCAAHVAAAFSDQKLTILDGGHCKKGIESTIIGFKNETPILYRLGAIPIEDIEAITGNVEIMNQNKGVKPAAPGMMKKHYAPRTPLVLIKNIDQLGKVKFGKNAGVILFTDNVNVPAGFQCEILSRHADPEEACANLYAALHRLDNAQLDFVFAELLPETGLGVTINDRLRRAASNIL